MDKTLVIFSVPRTGSNFVCNLINSFKEFECFGEVYHNKSVFAPYKRKQEFINYLTQVKGVEQISIGKNDYEDFELVKYAHQYPALFLESMQQTSQKKYLGFKLFQYHLSVEDMRRVLLENKNIIKLILKRNLLEAYASDCILVKNLKQLGNKAAHHLDTSQNKVKFDEKHFQNWLKRTTEYYSILENVAINFPKEYFFMTYEEVHKHDKNQDKASYVINSLNQMGFEIDYNQDMDNFCFIRKQDSRASVLEKFENPEAMKEFLFQNNLKSLLS